MSPSRKTVVSKKINGYKSSKDDKSIFNADNEILEKSFDEEDIDE